MNILEKKSWSPYAVGAGIGVLSWFSFLTAKKPIGITTAFENTAAGLGQRFAPKASGVNAYLAKNEEVPKLDWEWMLAAGVALGSWLSSTASGYRAVKRVPTVWASRFGSSSVARATIGPAGRRAAWLSAVGFVVVQLNLVFISYFVETSHTFQ